MPIEISLGKTNQMKSQLGAVVALSAIATAYNKANDPLYWTRCTIKGGAKFDKEAVLDAIIRRVSPTLVLPCLYQIEGDNSFFLLRSGKNMIKKVVDCSWVITDSTIGEPLEMSFIVEYLTVEEEPYDPIKNVEQVVKRRTNTKEGVIDLRNLQNDSDFINTYVSFHSLPLLHIILSYVRRNHKTFEVKGLILSHNNLEHLEMFDSTKYIDTVGTLDVRHNKLTFSGFNRLSRHLKINHIMLDGNPMCDDYDSPGEMICEIAQTFSSLQYLDNVEISYIPHFPQNRICLKLFIRNPAYSDLVDHFLHHYFLLFENDREKLIHTYHKNASFSVSVFRNELLHSASFPEFFASSNRNIMSMCDVTKTYDNIFIGKVRVFEALKHMPKLQFDFHTFNVDVPVTAKGELVVISCTGCFCISDDITAAKYSLSRICILCPLRNGLGEWLILNDMWNIMNVSPRAYPGFSVTRNRDVKSDFAVMLNPFLKDKDILKNVVSDLTHMKAAWVEKFLSESGWDLEMTLLAFTDQFKANLIPVDAFSARALSNE